MLALGQWRKVLGTLMVPVTDGLVQDEDKQHFHWLLSHSNTTYGGEKANLLGPNYVSPF